MTRSKAGDILLVTTAFVAFLVFSKRQAIGLLNYFISGIAIAMDGTTPVMRVEVAIQNPTNEDFQIRSFVGNLFAIDALGQSHTIGNVSAFGSIWVRSASQAIYPVYVRLNIGAIVSDIVNAIMQGSGPGHTIILDGTVNASGIVAPIRVDYKLF